MQIRITAPPMITFFRARLYLNASCTLPILPPRCASFFSGAARVPRRSLKETGYALPLNKKSVIRSGTDFCPSTLNLCYGQTTVCPTDILLAVRRRTEKAGTTDPDAGSRDQWNNASGRGSGSSGSGEKTIFQIINSKGARSAKKVARERIF